MADQQRFDVSKTALPLWNAYGPSRAVPAAQFNQAFAAWARWAFAGSLQEGVSPAVPAHGRCRTSRRGLPAAP